MKNSKFSLLNIIRYHKFIGISLAIWLLIMVVTGVLLNHSNDLELDKASITNKTILKVYGVKQPENGFSFLIKKNIFIHQFGEKLFFNQKVIENVGQISEKVLVASNNQDIFIYWNQHVVLLTLDGELIEYNEFFSVENAIAIGTDEAKSFYLKTKEGLFSGNSDDLEFVPSVMVDEKIKWHKSVPLTEEMIKRFSLTISYEGFTWERLLLDIHNGNVFGYFNKYLIDFLSFAFLGLIFSGIYIWFKKLK